MNWSNFWIPERGLDLLRYLCVWRINSSMARMPGIHFGVEAARVLGHLIAERLPTRQAAPWHKMLQSMPFGQERSPRHIPERLWPLEMALVPYPGKLTRGKGEIVLLEIKLFGDSAQHDLFLEWILPAMEEASYRMDRRWVSPNGLWGHFDIEAVMVAGAGTWLPLVQDGRLNLKYRPTPWQWAEGRTMPAGSARAWRQIIWMGSFDLGVPSRNELVLPDHDSSGQTVCFALSRLVEATLLRMNRLLKDAAAYPLGVWDLLQPDEREWLEIGLHHGEGVLHGFHDLSPVPPGFPGRWMGTQRFAAIPPLFLPYLDMASIVHIGRHTQFGCGTFTLK